MNLLLPKGRHITPFFGIAATTPCRGEKAPVKREQTRHTGVPRDYYQKTKNRSDSMTSDTGLLTPNKAEHTTTTHPLRIKNTPPPPSSPRMIRGAQQEGDGRLRRITLASAARHRASASPLARSAVLISSLACWRARACSASEELALENCQENTHTRTLNHFMIFMSRKITRKHYKYSECNTKRE